MITRKRGPYKDRIPAPTETPKRDDKIALGAAVSFLAERTKPAGEDRRAYRDKVYKRVKDARKKGEISVERDNKVVFGDFLGWAVLQDQKWAPLLADSPVSVTTEMRDEASLSDSGSQLSIPPTLEECAEALKRQHERILALSDEVEKLRPKAQRYDEICSTNQKNARKPRGET